MLIFLLTKCQPSTRVPELRAKTKGKLKAMMVEEHHRLVGNGWTKLSLVSPDFTNLTQVACSLGYQSVSPAMVAFGMMAPMQPNASHHAMGQPATAAAFGMHGALWGGGMMGPMQSAAASNHAMGTSPSHVEGPPLSRTTTLNHLNSVLWGCLSHY